MWTYGKKRNFPIRFNIPLLIQIQSHTMWGLRIWSHTKATEVNGWKRKKKKKAPALLICYILFSFCNYGQDNEILK